jgi:hypothetical protein
MTAVKAPHTETTIEHTGGQQNTGNHKKPGMPETGKVDETGGTRAGAENVEPANPGERPSGRSRT